MHLNRKEAKDMAKYLDPKADVTFKKVFGEHKNLVISLLNALLPLDDGKKVEAIEYLPPEMVPETPFGKTPSLMSAARRQAGASLLSRCRWSGSPTSSRGCYLTLRRRMSGNCRKATITNCFSLSIPSIW